MKKILLIFMISFNLILPVGAQTMDQDIKNTIVRLFVHTDQREWAALKSIFADTVLLDYSSFTKVPAAKLTPDEIISAWSGFLPGFKSTHHQITNFIVKHNGDSAQVHCYGVASHYYPNEKGEDLWIVVGSYNFELIRTSTVWKVGAMKFKFKYQDGNTKLPELIK